MKEKLFSGLFWVLILNLLIKPFWILGVERGVQNAVGAEMYGFYFAIFNITYIFNILLDIGITNFNTRNIASNPDLIRKHLSGILSIKILLLGLYLIIVFSVGYLLGYDSQQFRLLSVLAINQFLNSLILYLRSNFEGLLLFKWDSVLSVLDRILMIAICGVLLWSDVGPKKFQIEWLAYSQTAAYTVTAVVALSVLWRKTGLQKLHFDKIFTLAILKRSLPFALLVLLMASYNRLDPILLSQILPADMADYQTGIYAGAFRLLDALTMIAYLVSVPLLPVYARLIASRTEADQQQIASITQTMTTLMILFATSLAISLSFQSTPIMSLMYASQTNVNPTEYATVFSILIYDLIPISMTYVFGTLLTANGSLKQLNILAFSSLIINIILNVILIPQQGAEGSAWASLTAQSFMALTQIILSIKIFNIKWSPTYWFKILLVVGGVLTVNLVGSRVPMVWEVLLSFAVALTLCILLKIIDLREATHTILNIIKPAE